MHMDDFEILSVIEVYQLCLCGFFLFLFKEQLVMQQNGGPGKGVMQLFL